MKTRNDITAAVWVGNEPEELSVSAQAGFSGDCTILRFGPGSEVMVWFRPDARFPMLMALRDKIDAHLKEIADNG